MEVCGCSFFCTASDKSRGGHVRTTGDVPKDHPLLRIMQPQMTLNSMWTQVKQSKICFPLCDNTVISFAYCCRSTITTNDQNFFSQSHLMKHSIDSSNAEMLRRSKTMNKNHNSINRTKFIQSVFTGKADISNEW